MLTVIIQVTRKRAIEYAGELPEGQRKRTRERKSERERETVIIRESASAVIGGSDRGIVTHVAEDDEVLMPMPAEYHEGHSNHENANFAVGSTQDANEMTANMYRVGGKV